MFALCLESSHARGMGHLFRVVHLSSRIKELGWPFIIVVNHHEPASSILEKYNLPYEVVDFEESAEWELDIIKRYEVKVWVNDRLDTSAIHARRVKEADVKLATFDDRGPGANYVDVNFASMCFDNSEVLHGSKVLRGVKYLILNQNIRKYKRVRERLDRIVVTLGGSDTYGVTASIVALLAERQESAAVIVGPGFEHIDELQSGLPKNFVLKIGVPCLAKEFSKHDLAITGGGITPFEANAAGLPCIIVANELFEIPVGLFLQKLGGAVFAGHHTKINESVFDCHLNIRAMSQAGMHSIGLEGTTNVCYELEQLWGA